MSETIINSNQVRASGDTSTETLINENQVRQAGDTSSQTLINPNQIAQTQKALNAVFVGTGIVDENYILSPSKGSIDYAFTFAMPIDDTNTFKMKMKIKGDTSFPTERIIFGTGGTSSFTSGLGGNVGQTTGTPSLLCGGTGGNFGWANYPYLYADNFPYSQADVWWWLEFGYDGTNFFYSVSLDGVNYQTRNLVQRVSTLAFQTGNVSFFIIGNANLYLDLKVFEFWKNGELAFEMLSQSNKENLNFSITGSVINNNNVISGFSSSNYLSVSKSIDYKTDVWEVILDVTATDFSNDLCVFATNNFNVLFSGNTTTKKLKIDGQSSTGTKEFYLNTNYKIKIAVARNRIFLHYWENGNWVLDVNYSIIYSISSIVLGGSYNHDGTKVFKGSYNLNNSCLRQQNKDGLTEYKFALI